MLYVAAQFASIDSAKQMLTGILVRPAKDGGIKLDSTNGMRAFNVTCSDPVWHCDKPLLLDPKSFAKRISHAKTVNIKADEDAARILGGKGEAMDFMQAVPWRLQLDGFVGDPIAKYPDIDSLWPCKFNNLPGQPIGFNAQFMIDFLKQVKSYSWNCTVKMESNGATNPFMLTSTIHDGCGLNDVKMRYLLCPIQLRSET